MRIAIVGSGAMGQLFGARLQLAGNDVVFFDTQQHTLDTLNDVGITLDAGSGPEHVQTRAKRAEDENDPFELIVIFTKGFHTRAAVESVRHLIGPGSLGLSLQNGLGHAEIISEAFGPGRTVVGVTDFPADPCAHGHIRTTSYGSVRLGALTARGNHASEIAQVLTKAKLNAQVEEDVRVPIWEKVAFNSALNTLSAVTGRTVGDLGKSPQAREIAATVLQETQRVATSQAVELSLDRVNAALDNAYIHHGSHKTSMLLDREAGRPTEVDYIGGAVVEIGMRAGVPTPVLKTLCDLVRALTVS